MFAISIERGSIYRQGILVGQVRTVERNPGPKENAMSIVYLEGAEVLRARLKAGAV
jgi:hypothetical protein